MNSINIPTRRTFLHKTALAGLALPFIPAVSFIDRAHGAVFHKPKDLENLTDLEKIHVPKVTLPPVVEMATRLQLLLKWITPWTKITTSRASRSLISRILL